MIWKIFLPLLTNFLKLKENRNNKDRSSQAIVVIPERTNASKIDQTLSPWEKPDEPVDAFTLMHYFRY